jgi:type VI protein secretion system component Hcp
MVTLSTEMFIMMISNMFQGRSFSTVGNHLRAWVLALLLGTAMSSQAAISAYIQFTTSTGTILAGDSTSKDFPGTAGWTEFPSMSASVEQVVSSGISRVTFNPLSFQKMVNSMTPALLAAAGSGVAYRTVNLVFCRPDFSGKAVQFMKITLGLAKVWSQSWDMSAGSDQVGENVSLDYAGLYVLVTPLNPNGSTGTPVGGGWNRIKNIAWDGVAGL